MDKYRKKPVVIEAIQWDGTVDSFEKIEEFAGDYGVVIEDTRIMVETWEGWKGGTPGYWIIKGVKGEVYPCKPDIFELTYEPVEGEDV